MLPTLAGRPAVCIGALCLLYAAQGIPDRFVRVGLKQYLADRGTSAGQIGLLIAAISWPWAIKWIWGPILDRFTGSTMGRRRPWILFAGLGMVSMLALLLATELTTGRVAESLVLLAAMVLSVNLFAAMLDVAVDATAIELLPEKQRGAANGLMQASLAAGSFLGGQGLGLLLLSRGLATAIAAEIALLLVILTVPLALRERPGDAFFSLRRRAAADSAETSRPRDSEAQPAASHALKESHDTDAAAGSPRSPSQPDASQPYASTPAASAPAVSPPASSASPTPPTTAGLFRLLLRVFRVRSVLLAALFAFTSCLAHGAFLVMWPLHLRRQLDWSAEALLRLEGSYAIPCEIAGALLGGVLASRFGARRSTFLSASLLSSVFLLHAVVPHRPTIVTGLYLVEVFAYGLLTVSMFSLFMSLAYPPIAATQFSAMMAILNLSQSTGSLLTGFLDNRPLQYVFVLLATIQLLIGLLLTDLDPEEAERMLTSTV